MNTIETFEEITSNVVGALQSNLTEHGLRRLLALADKAEYTSIEITLSGPFRYTQSKRDTITSIEKSNVGSKTKYKEDIGGILIGVLCDAKAIKKIMSDTAKINHAESISDETIQATDN